jgi:hypothetical protein
MVMISRFRPRCLACPVRGRQSARREAGRASERARHAFGEAKCEKVVALFSVSRPSTLPIGGCNPEEPMASSARRGLDDLHLPADGLALAARLPPVPPPPPPRFLFVAC